ncbi:hypothetical protein AHAS_Ahas17G0210200 [Arachis hypogaea]
MRQRRKRVRPLSWPLLPFQTSVSPLALVAATSSTTNSSISKPSSFLLFHNKTLLKSTATATTCATSSHNHNHNFLIPKPQQHQYSSLFSFSDEDKNHAKSAASLESTVTPKPPTSATSHPTLSSIAVKKVPTRPTLRPSLRVLPLSPARKKKKNGLVVG